MFKIIHFKSRPKNNPFAPEWNYSIVETNLNNINLKSLNNYLIKKEKDILKLKNGIDGYTGLGKKSITSRHSSYNIFKFKNKEIQKLTKEILKTHNLFLKKLNLPLPSKLVLKGWYNILRKDESINPHAHSFHPDTYLGGHFCVSCKDTSTFYINPINPINDPETYKSLNKPGKLTLFQNFIPHYTDKNKHGKRVTIAFDLNVVSRHKEEIELKNVI